MIGLSVEPSADLLVRARTPWRCTEQSLQYLNKASFLQVLFVNHGSILRQLTPFLQQPFDVFADEIGFEVDGVIHLLKSECGDFRGVRDDRNAERMVADFIDGQADAIHCDGSFCDAVAENFRRSLDCENACVALLPPAA